MYTSLQKMDIVVKEKAGTGHIAYQADHRQTEQYEEERALSTLFALARVINPQRSCDEDGEGFGVVYATAARPPDWFRRVVASAGAALKIERTTIPWEGDLDDPGDLADGAFHELAERVRSREGRGLDVDLLEQLEDEILADPPSVEEDEASYWTRVMELAAVGSELIRKSVGGRWVREDRWYSTVPFVFRQQGNKGLFNVAGKAERCIDRGDGQRVSRLVYAAAESARAEEGRPLVTLKPASWALHPIKPGVRGRPILERVNVEVPRVVLCRDLPNSIAMFADDEKRWDGHYAEAMANLSAIQVEIEEVDWEGFPLLVVSGAVYAAEKILDVSFLRCVQERLGTRLLAIGVPYRGVLLVIDGRAPSDTLSKFMSLCESYHEDTDGEPPISPLSFVAENGKLTGYLRFEEDGASKAQLPAGDGASKAQPPAGKAFRPRKKGRIFRRQRRGWFSRRSSSSGGHGQLPDD